MFSDDARWVWAKSLYIEGTVGQWMPLWLHLRDTAGVAEYLFDQWLSESQRRMLAEPFCGGDPDENARSLARSILVFMAAVHDVGKSSPAFARLVPELAQRLELNGFSFPADHPKVEWHHEFVSQVDVVAWLSGRGNGWAQMARAIGSVVGAHHRFPKIDDDVRAALESDRSGSKFGKVMGGDKWPGVRAELMAWAWVYSSCDSRELRVERAEKLDGFMRLALGFLNVADWFASNADYFPLVDFDSDGSQFADEGLYRQRFQRAVEQMDLPPRFAWPQMQADADLMASLGLPQDASMRPIQSAAVQAARQMTQPGLMVIQDQMGAGKTEAGLMAAQILAARFGFDGILYTLPTQVTTNAMWDRIVPWLHRIHEASAGGGEVQSWSSVELIHGRAWLKSDFSEMKDAYGAFDPQRINSMSNICGGSDMGRRSHDSLVVHPWFSSRRRALLSRFAVSTIDTALFAALDVPYVSLRHLGMTSKVVLIDEVHSFSLFMDESLFRMLTWLGAYGVPVIALSATLSDSKLNQMNKAYLRGARFLSPRDVKVEPPISSFPQISVATADGQSYTAVQQYGKSQSFSFECLELDRLAESVREQLESGGCALVVRNTVSSAQNTALELMQAFPDVPVYLNHSRFAAADRQRNDAELLRLFRAGSLRRPNKAIVVSTQVVEQSLDVDFDVLYTDLAPVDVLFQRVGRVHRSARTERPEGLRDPRVFVMGAGDSAEEAEIRSKVWSKIYGGSLLDMAAKVLEPYLGGESVMVPDMLKELVNQQYLKPLRTSNNRMLLVPPVELASQLSLENLSLQSKCIAGSDAADGDDSSPALARVRDGVPSVSVALMVRIGSDYVPYAAAFADRLGCNDVGDAVLYELSTVKISELLFSRILDAVGEVDLGGGKSRYVMQFSENTVSPYTIRKNECIVCVGDGGSRISYGPNLGLRVDF